jgi:hypothetical protein
MFRGINLKQLYQSPLVLAALIAFTYVFLLLDTLKYPGFTGNHFLIDARVYVAVSIGLLLIWPLSPRILKVILRISFVGLAIMLSIYIWFSVAEATHYINYVLSQYNLSLQGLVYVPVFSAMIFVVSKIRLKNAILLKGRNIWQTMLIIIIAYALISNIGASLENAVEQDIYIFAHPQSSYDQKMHYQWHEFYHYMLFVKNNTSEDASIIIPPQLAPWWTSSGNEPLVRYFLFPRNLIQYKTETIPDIKSVQPGTLIMVAWGEWECDLHGCKGWPTQVIKSKKAIFKAPNSSDLGETKENFLYDPKDASRPYGLLTM